MENTKLVSIGLPIYNGGAQLSKTLDQLLGQAYPHIELVISDNASTDNTEALCREYAARDKRIVYVRQKENQGLVKNFFEVLQHASGDFFMWAANDDIRDPQSIELLLAQLETYPDCSVAMSGIKRVYDDGAIKDELDYRAQWHTDHLTSEETFKRLINDEPLHLFIYGLFRTKQLKRIMKRPWPMCISNDRVFMSEIALTGGFCTIPQILFTKTASRKKISERYKHEAWGQVWLNPKAQSIYIKTMLMHALTSRAVPFSKKHIILKYWIPIAWRNRRRLLFDMLPMRFIRFGVALKKAIR